MKDLVVLVPDKSTEQVIKGLLQRHQALQIRPLTYDVFVHPRRDPGCLNGAPDFLRQFATSYEHALVVLDHEGCGRERDDPRTLADGLKSQLGSNGWAQRAQAVVVAPELEVWVWSRSPQVARCLGWGQDLAHLRRWLAAEGYWPRGNAKPPRPKEAMEAALRRVRKPLSSTVFYDLAISVSLTGHTEPAFVRLTSTLRGWFPPTQPARD